jgi:hypothetical protein
MNWPLAAVIIAALFFGSCAVCVSMAAKSTSQAIDYTTRVICYDQGYMAGVNRIDISAPMDGSECSKLFDRGEEHGRAGVYSPPTQ